MSATGRGGVRREGDAYYTPDELARALVAVLPPIRGDVSATGQPQILEPSVGGGAFVRAVLALPGMLGARFYGVDVDSKAAGLELCDEQHVGDFMRYQGGWFDLIIGNPPYAQAEQHLRRALEMRGHTGVVAFLLRLAFLESQQRAALWRVHAPSDVYVLTERPSFTVDGKTDATAYAWYVWDPEREGETRLHWLSWKGKG